jgi:hypothetical protein
MITAKQVTTTIRVSDLKPGDLVDLYGDPFADPNQDPRHCHEFEYATVCEVIPETPGCVAVSFHLLRGFEGFDIVGFPPEHVLVFAGRVEGYV